MFFIDSFPITSVKQLGAAYQEAANGRYIEIQIKFGGWLILQAIFCVRCSIAQIAGWLYSKYSRSLYTFAMQSKA
jgi:hypothetical protein